MLIRALPTAGRGLAAASIAATLVGALLPPAFTIASGAIAGALPDAVTDGTGSAAANRLVMALAASTAIFVAIHISGPIRETLGDVLMRRLDEALTLRLMRAVSLPRGVAHLEDPVVLDKIAQAQGAVTGATPGSAAYYLVQVWAQRVQASMSLVLVATFDVRLAALLLAGHLCAYRFHKWHWNEVTTVIMGRTEALRQSHYLRDLSVEPDAAKEIRIFSLSDWLVGRYRQSYLDTMAVIWRTRRNGGGVAVAVAVLLLALEVLSLVAIVRAGVAGTISLATVVVVSQATVAASNLGTFGEGHVWVHDGAVALGILEELEHLVPAATHELGGDQHPAGLPARSIRFEGVRFRYAGREDDVFDGLDLEIETGRSLAIVGENGAGKTTLVKLLARLYDPTEGRITVDGIDLRAIDPESWQRRVAAIFQDFVQLHLTAYDNIALGALHRADDQEAVAAAANQAGAAAIIEGLPRRWDTVLSRQFTGGADLSGGEWQRMALARAMFAVAGGAGVLILDEPTAALDVRGEAEIYERFLELIQGITTIVISHRFSTVRRADRIVVLEHGRVVEDGTHDELVVAGGRYARMYALQAARFQDSADA